MTFKSLMNFGGFHDTQSMPAMDRYHGGGHYDHGHSHGWKGKGHGGGGGTGNGAALSALTLLAFLFLMNVMQQSLQDNNTTETTTATTIFLRDDQQPVSLTSRHDDYESLDATENTLKTDSKKEKTYVKIRKP